MGNEQWTTSGVVITTSATACLNTFDCGDGTVLWNDHDVPVDEGGFRLDNLPYYDFALPMISDGQGGAGILGTAENRWVEVAGAID